MVAINPRLSKRKNTGIFRCLLGINLVIQAVEVELDLLAERGADVAILYRSRSEEAEAVLEAARLRAASAETTPKASLAAAEPPAARRRPHRR